MYRGDFVHEDNIYCNRHHSLRVKQGLHIRLATQITRGDKLRPETVSCLTAHGGVCAMNSPRSFFSFEKESNFLRRDFLRLRISVKRKETKWPWIKVLVVLESAQICLWFIQKSKCLVYFLLVNSNKTIAAHICLPTLTFGSSIFVSFPRRGFKRPSLRPLSLSSLVCLLSFFSGVLVPHPHL